MPVPLYVPRSKEGNDEDEVDDGTYPTIINIQARKLTVLSN